MLTGHDIYLFKEGSHAALYRQLGCQLAGTGEAHFAVWAPNAREVATIPRPYPTRQRVICLWRPTSITDDTVAELREQSAGRPSPCHRYRLPYVDGA